MKTEQVRNFSGNLLGATGQVLLMVISTNLRDIIANPAALALRHRAEEGKAQRNASAELPLCVSVT